MSWKPIALGHFHLEATSLMVKGRPSFAEAAVAGWFLRRVHTASPFWLGDWYLAVKQLYPDRYTQLLKETGYDEDTLVKFSWVCERVPPSRRELAKALPFSIIEAVAGLDPTQQRQMLTRAKDEHMTVSDVRQRVRQLRRRPVESGSAELSGQFRVVLADPPYALEPGDGGLSLALLASVPVLAHTRPESVLFLYCPERLRFAVKDLLDAWGFEHRTAFVLDKIIHERPHAFLDETHEHILIATRGTCPPDRTTPLLDSVVVHRGPARPPQIVRHIERLYDGPYLLLFPGDAVPAGWVGYGRPAAHEQPA